MILNQEDELSRSIASYRAEADACNAFIEFMESTWGFQSAFTAEKKKQIKYKVLSFASSASCVFYFFQLITWHI